MPGGHWVVVDCCSSMLERMLNEVRLVGVCTDDELKYEGTVG